MKELFNSDTQPITQLLNGGDGSASVAAADNVVHSRLGDAAHMAQLVNGEISFLTQLQDAFFYCFAYIHGEHLVSNDDAQSLLRSGSFLRLF